MLAGNTAYVVPGDFESIATFTVGSGGSISFDFQSIPSTYQHLQLRLLGRNVRASSATDFIRMRFNNDTASNYRQEHALLGNGSTAVSGNSAAGTAVFLNPIAASDAGSNNFASAVIDILDYTSTNKYKTVRYLMGFDNNGSGEIRLGSGLWFNSSIAAINRITITPAFGDWVQYSQAALYGIKG
jgi:hypothetical protein